MSEQQGMVPTRPDDTPRIRIEQVTSIQETTAPRVYGPNTYV
jgi:hypothetical protein